jgi:hypothetical protein
MTKLNDDKVAEAMQGLAEILINNIADYAVVAEENGASEEDYSAAVYAVITALVIGFEEGMEPETLAAAKELIKQDVL